MFTTCACVGLLADRFPEVLSVLAMADQDGKSGGKAFYCPAGDFTAAGNYSTDSYALFSNYVSKGDVVAESHTVAAPGVCIRSTYPYNLGRWDKATMGSAVFAGAFHIVYVCCTPNVCTVASTLPCM